MIASTIYVRLLDEGVDVWRPVDAIKVNGDTYQILEQPYDRETEQWEFGPGDRVVCELIQLQDGMTLVAMRRSDGQ